MNDATYSVRLSAPDPTALPPGVSVSAQGSRVWYDVEDIQATSPAEAVAEAKRRADEFTDGLRQLGRPVPYDDTEAWLAMSGDGARSTAEVNPPVTRLQILRAIDTALGDIHDLVAELATAPDLATALDRLQDSRGLTREEATAVLDLQLRRVVADQRAHVRAELEQLSAE